MDASEDSFRKLMKVPDTHEVHFFNGGATLQFAAVPMNLLGAEGGKATYIMSGHWSEKASNEAKMYTDPHLVRPTDYGIRVLEVCATTLPPAVSKYRTHPSTSPYTLP